MKVCFSIATLFAVATAIAQTIVVVDMEEVLAQHPNTAGDKKILASTLEDYTQERNELRATLQKKEADLERKIKEAQNPMLAPAKAEDLRRACEAAFRQLEQDQIAAENKMAERTRQLQEMEKRLVKRTTDEIHRKISDYALVQGYDLVLYKNLVPYVSAELDITDNIIALCGGKVKAPEAETPAVKPAPLPPAPTTPAIEQTTPVPAPATPVIEQSTPAPKAPVAVPAKELKAPLKVEFTPPVIEPSAPEADSNK